MGAADLAYAALGFALLLAIGIAVLWRAFTRSEARLRAGVQELAGAALRDNTDLFLKLARESFGREQADFQGLLREREMAFSALIEPLRGAIEKTEAQAAAMERERRDAYSTLRTQIESLALGQSALQRETRNLVTALRRPEVRGRWGELTLRRVVELAGLSAHCDFDEQPSIGGGASALRPDLVVHMPEGRELVVDAKTPLDAYLEAIEAPTDEARAVAVARHARQVAERVRELASKSYWSALPRSPEFVVLFLPGDQFLSSALAERPDLLDDALRLGVIVATPSTLIALLKAVAYGWRQAAVAENAAQIRDLGQELHRRLATFASHIGRMGRQLGGAVDAYNSAVGSLERQVLPGARKFGELGVSTADPLAGPDPIEQAVRSLRASGEEQGS